MTILLYCLAAFGVLHLIADSVVLFFLWRLNRELHEFKEAEDVMAEALTKTKGNK